MGGHGDMESKGYKIVVTKSVSQDEQLQMELCADTATGLEIRLAQGLAILDQRLAEQGKRVIDATTWVQQFPPEVKMAVNAIIGTLYGRPGAIQEVQTAAEAVNRMAAPQPSALDETPADSASVPA
jgi:hypothetical protein